MNSPTGCLTPTSSCAHAEESLDMILNPEPLAPLIQLPVHNIFPKVILLSISCCCCCCCYKYNNHEH